MGGPQRQLGGVLGGKNQIELKKMVLFKDQNGWFVAFLFQLEAQIGQNEANLSQFKAQMGQLEAQMG